DPEHFSLERERFQEDMRRLAQEVEEQENAHELDSSRARGVLDRAALAYRRGLAGKASKLLMASDISAFGVQGLRLEVDLLLRTGRSKDVESWVSAEHEGALGASDYHWVRARASAASGDYDLAVMECNQLA